MVVAVVDVGKVWVTVNQCLVDVRMRMRFTRRISGRMHVLVMGVVNMRMFVRQQLVGMPVGVALRQV